jgi:hypothetical protein
MRDNSDCGPIVTVDRMIRALAVGLSLLCAGAVHAESQTPPGTWMLVIKDGLRNRLVGGARAKFSRMFYDSKALAAGGFAICGKVTSQESAGEGRKTRYFYGVFLPESAADPAAFTDVRIGRTTAESGEIRQTCSRLGLL